MCIRDRPKVIRVELTGSLRPFVTAKDVSLELLRILSVKGGVGHVIEWGGPGVASLSCLLYTSGGAGHHAG